MSQEQEQEQEHDDGNRGVAATPRTSS